MTTAADAILAVVRAAVPVGVTVYDTIVTGVASQRYVIMHIPPAFRESITVDAGSDAIHVSFHAMIVASNDYPGFASPECVNLAERIITALVDTVITADRMSPARIVMDGVNPPQPDEVTPDKKVFIQSQFSFRSVAA